MLTDGRATLYFCVMCVSGRVPAVSFGAGYFLFFALFIVVAIYFLLGYFFAAVHGRYQAVLEVLFED